MQVAKRDLDKELGAPYHRSFPCCTDAPGYKKALQDRKLGTYNGIPDAQKKLLRHCKEGILLDDESTFESHSVSTAPMPMIRSQLTGRGNAPKTEDLACREQLKKILLQERQRAQLTSVLRNSNFHGLNPDVLLTDDMRGLILCALHGDMRMGEKLLNLLFGKCVRHFAKAVADPRIKKAAATLAKYARLGSYFKVRYDAEDGAKLAPIQLNGDKIRRVFALTHLVGVDGANGVDPDSDEILGWDVKADN